MQLTYAVPVDRESDNNSNGSGRNGFNDIFQQINFMLHKKILKQVKDDSLEIGDHYTDGDFSLNVQHFSNGNSFPVFFNPNSDEDLLDDKEITEIFGDFDDSAEYKINHENSSETTQIDDSEEETTEVSKEPHAVTKEESASTSANSTTTTPITTQSTSQPVKNKI